MKVIQIPYCFHPDPVGGTEVYVETLTRHLQDSDIDVIVSAPAKNPTEAYFHNGLKVRRFGVSERLNNLSELYGEANIRGAASFGRILDEEKPDLIHLHAFICEVSLRLVREAKERNIPTIFTYHTPAVSCQRGTLMRWGKKVCDGKLDSGLCTGCFLQKLGLPKGIAKVFSAIPGGANDILSKVHLSGGIWTAMRMHGLMSIRQATFRAFMNEVDKIVALCSWTHDVLLRNGIPREKITIIRHGLSNLNTDEHRWESQINADGLRSSLRVVYIGRLDPTKGVDILIRAVKSLPKVPVELDIYGVIQAETGKKYLQKLKKMAAKDLRIVFKNAVSNDEIIPLLKKYHVLAVPSQWLETGPLVVLEAFAAGIPVIGSDLGGIAELVTHEVNGLLVEHNSIESWRGTLKRIVYDRNLVVKLQKNIKPVETAEKTAEEIVNLYGNILE